MSKRAFSTKARSRFAPAVFDSVLGPLCLSQHTCLCPCSSVIPEATHEVSWGPLQSAVSAQNSRVRDGERELLGGMEEKTLSQKGNRRISSGQTWMSTILRSGQLSMWFRSSCLLMWWVALKGQITRAFSGNCFHPAGHKHSARRFKGIVHQGRGPALDLPPWHLKVSILDQYSLIPL